MFYNDLFKENNLLNNKNHQLPTDDSNVYESLKFVTVSLWHGAECDTIAMFNADKALSCCKYAEFLGSQYHNDKIKVRFDAYPHQFYRINAERYEYIEMAMKMYAVGDEHGRIIALFARCADAINYIDYIADVLSGTIIRQNYRLIGTQYWTSGDHYEWWKGYESRCFLEKIYERSKTK